MPTKGASRPRVTLSKHEVAMLKQLAVAKGVTKTQLLKALIHEAYERDIAGLKVGAGISFVPVSKPRRRTSAKAAKPRARSGPKSAAAKAKAAPANKRIRATAAARSTTTAAAKPPRPASPPKRRKAKPPPLPRKRRTASSGRSTKKASR